MVVSIPHDIAFDMHHVVCKGIPHDHFVSFVGMWYVFS